jgi:hypothetical protein
MSNVTHAYFEGLTPDITNFQGGVTSDAIKESTVKITNCRNLKQEVADPEFR